MRLYALKDLGIASVPCKILDASTSVETLKKIVLLDNASFGSYDYDLLANDWEQEMLEAMGLDLWNTLEKFEDLNYNSGEDEPNENDKPNKKIILKVTSAQHAEITDFLLNQGDGESLEVGMLSAMEIIKNQ